MKGRVLVIALLVSGCEREPQSSPAVGSSDTVQAVIPVQTSKPAPLVPVPQDQAELDSMILAGYTPHGDHLHSPGVKECPLNQGTKAVM